MGAATPIQLDQGQAQAVGEKMVSYFRSEMRSTAEAKGRDGSLAEAMVDADTYIPTVSPKGKLLTLTTEDAVSVGVADGQADSPEELQQLLGYQEHLVVRESTSWAEDLARAVTDPTVSGLLMSLGMMGIMIELYTPGIGIAGALGVTSLFTFFFGHKVAGLAGSGELLLILLGLILLALEVFVIPGFGVAGIAGLFLLALGFITSMGELPKGGEWDMSVFETPVQTFVYALLCTVVLTIVLAKYLPHTPFGSWLVLRSSLSDRTEDEHQYEMDGSTLSHQVKVGDHGATTTPLRLSGKAEINGQVIDVISRDEYLEPKQQVRVVEVSGSRIVVVAS
jgi:membrane-bound serine protease (ClpP class)